jgi:hypothetical protein
MLPRRASLLYALLSFLLALPGAVQAQWRTRPYTGEGVGIPRPMVVASDTANPTMAMVGGGLLGGAVGFVGGGLLGATIERSFGCEGVEWCGLGGGFLGAVIGETTMVALGVHLANDSRGEYTAVLAGSLGSVVAGFALGGLLHKGEVLLVVPVAQVVIATTLERRSTRPAVPER